MDNLQSTSRGPRGGASFRHDSIILTRSFHIVLYRVFLVYSPLLRYRFHFVTLRKNNIHFNE